MQSKFYVRFVVVDESLSPEEITKRTGISPSQTWYKGEYRPKTLILEKENGWELDSELPEEFPLIDHINSLLSKLDSVKGQLQEFTKKYYSAILCSVYFYEDTPEINFDRNTIKRLAELNLELDIDLYCLDSDTKGSSSTSPQRM